MTSAHAGSWIAGMLSLSGLLAQEPAPAQGRLEGVVVDCRSAPVPLAEVELLCDDEVVALTKCDGIGRFVFGRLEPRSYQVAARAPQHTAAKKWAGIVGAGDAAWVQLQLFDGVQLHGVVRDAAGAPIEGARLVAARMGMGELLATMVAAEATSDAEGRYRLFGVPVGGAELAVAAAGFELLETSCELAADGELDLQLLRGDSMALRLRIEGATPEQLRAARCDIQAIRGPGRRLVLLPQALRSGRPGDDGIWQASGLPRDAQVSSARVVIAGATVLPRPSGVTPSGPVHELVFQVLGAGAPAVAPPPRLRGRLRDRSGAPLAKRRLLVQPRDNGRRTIEATTGDDGTFAVESPVGTGAWLRIRLADQDLVVLQEGREPRMTLYHGSEQIVKCDGDQELLVTVAPAVRLRGRLLDTDGRPLFGVRVELWQAMGEQLPSHDRFASTSTDRDGRFEFRQLNGHLDRKLRLDVTNGAAHSIALELPHEGLDDIGDVRLPNPAEIHGVVTDADGAPRAGVELVLAELQHAGRMHDFVLMRWTMSDRQGRYRFADLVPGRYRVGPVGDPATTKPFETECELEGDRHDLPLQIPRAK
jgi:protocatechuate 3,4-dioxygenase beta subunit